jgi:cholesterol oxidase
MPGGITFNETMEGWFALGATTAEAGARRGEQDGTRLAMHATVTIDDLDRFITVREHPGSLIGTVDFQPLGLGLQARSGVFQLFSPGPGEDSRRMVYELAFQAGGKAYYLAGEKRVRNETGPDLWRDTTTLYTMLHEGSDRSGPAAGAGILTLGIAQLLALMSTFKPINGGDLSTVAAFGRFFFGELWDVYAPHLRGSGR